MQVIILLNRLFSFVLSLLFLFSSTPVYASDISANSAISIDMASGDILYEKCAYSPMEMASTTKIMTCLIACESDKLYDTVTITDEMLDGTYGSLIYAKTGDKISLLDLVKGAMLASGNDAANSIAVFLAGSVSAFVDIMNARAKDIGMKDTTFVTPSGLDEGDHHSTAYDMAILACVAMQNEIFAQICCLSSAEIKINGKPQMVYNHNKLLGYDKCFVGVKTGFTDRAGRCLVSAYNYEGNTIISVTLNAPNDWEDHKKIVSIAKKKYKKITNSKKISISLVGGNNDTVTCYYSYDIITVGEMEEKIYYYPFLYAPLKKGDRVGMIKLYKNNKLIRTVEITVLKDEELWQITK